MKPIKGFEERYAVTETGEVWSLPKSVQVGTQGGFRQQPLQRLRGTRPKKDKAHLRVYLAKNGKKFPALVHRLVAEAFIPNPYHLPFVNHKDGNPENNRMDNLEWCSVQGNTKHAFDLGLITTPVQAGERNSQAKLSETCVKTIRAKHTAGESCAAIARQLGLSPKTINDIVHRKRWPHIV